MINSLELTNFRSYKSQVVHLTSGINVLVGSSGAGKSNILRAIGQCLFHWSDRSQKDLLRRGSRHGSVVIALEDEGVNIERVYGQAAAWRVYNAGAEDLLDEGVENVSRYLGELLGVAGDLSHAFANIVAVRQLRVHEGFDDSPGERKRRFNAVIGVDRFEALWAKMAAVEVELKDRSSRLALFLREKSARLNALSEGVVGHDSLIAQIGTLERNIDNLRGTIDKCSEAGSEQDVRCLEKDLLSESMRMSVDRAAMAVEHNGILKEIALIDSGKCPTCGTPLTSEEWQEKRAELVGVSKYSMPTDPDMTTMQSIEAELEILRSSMSTIAMAEIGLAGGEAALKAVKSDLARMDSISAEIVKINLEINQGKGRMDQIRSAASAASSIRMAFRKAGPAIGRRLVSSISHQANQIFSQAVPDGELEWLPDYSVRLKLSGVDHGFDGSDGQKVLASLAIRLGMAKVLNKTGLLLLDEVTMGAIDPDLARLIPEMVLALDMKQVICIDHGHLFNTVASNIIEVKNDGGESKIG